MFDFTASAGLGDWGINIGTGGYGGGYGTQPYPGGGYPAGYPPYPPYGGATGIGMSGSTQQMLMIGLIILAVVMFSRR